MGHREGRKPCRRWRKNLLVVVSVEEEEGAAEEYHLAGAGGGEAGFRRRTLGFVRSVTRGGFCCELEVRRRRLRMGRRRRMRSGEGGRRTDCDRECGSSRGIGIGIGKDAEGESEGVDARFRDFRIAERRGGCFRKINSSQSCFLKSDFIEKLSQTDPLPALAAGKELLQPPELSQTEPLSFSSNHNGADPWIAAALMPRSSLSSSFLSRLLMAAIIIFNLASVFGVLKSCIVFGCSVQKCARNRRRKDVRGSESPEEGRPASKHVPTEETIRFPKPVREKAILQEQKLGGGEISEKLQNSSRFLKSSS
ncbi:hypothetical protein KSP40_PGU022408 [Platanthera guangdongensis]|uniref:Uncharacterized protein n=1 Tax=Platanthera guangdongensis TaxID=2320717 RepID=A0ABR2M3I7_9ASPA